MVESVEHIAGLSLEAFTPVEQIAGCLIWIIGKAFDIIVFGPSYLVLTTVKEHPRLHLVFFCVFEGAPFFFTILTLLFKSSFNAIKISPGNTYE